MALKAGEGLRYTFPKLRRAIAFILVLVALRLVVAGLCPLLPDEAYYLSLIHI